MAALVLSREDYLNIFHQKHNLEDIQQFLSGQSWFQHWPVEKLDNKHIIEKYYRNGILISDGTEIPRYIHVLKAGQARAEFEIFSRIAQKFDVIIFGQKWKFWPLI